MYESDTPIRLLDALDDDTAAALACPSWCELAPDHVEEFPDVIARRHRRVIGSVLIQSCDTPNYADVLWVTVESDAFFDRDDASVSVEHARVVVQGAPDEGLPAASLTDVAGLLTQAAVALAGTGS